MLLHRRHKQSWYFFKPKKFIKDHLVGVLHIPCVTGTLCDMYIACQKSHYFVAMDNTPILSNFHLPSLN